MPVVMQSFAAVRSVFLWAQLNGDPLQALLNILGVEVDVHPRVLVALAEVIGAMQSRSLHLQSLRRRLISQNGGGQGGGSLDSCWFVSVYGVFFCFLREKCDLLSATWFDGLLE